MHELNFDEKLEKQGANPILTLRITVANATTLKTVNLLDTVYIRI